MANPDGSFEFPEAPPGNYLLKAPGAAGMRLTVHDKDLVVNLRPEYEGAGVKVSGAVEDAENFPTGVTPTVFLMRIRSVTLPNGISMSGGAGITFETIVRPDSTFSFPRIPPGVYMLGTYPRTAPLRRLIEVTESDVTGLRLAVMTYCRIKGRVFVEGGETPVPKGISIQFAGKNIDIGYYSGIQPDGSFEALVHADQYKVAAVHLPVGFVSGPVRHGDRDVKDLLTIDSRPTAEITVTLQTVPLDSIPGFTIRGRTTRPVQDARVHLFPPAHANYPTELFELASNCTFEIPKVLPGTYSLTLSGRMPGVVETAVAVVDRDVTGVVIAIPPLFDIAVQVETVDETGAALPFGPAQARLSFHSSEEYRALTLKAGYRLSVALGEGAYKFSIEDLPAGYTIKSMTSGAIDLSKDSLRLKDGVNPPDTVHVSLEYKSS